MKKIGEKSIRFFLSCILILNFFVSLKPLKVNGVSFDGGSGTPEDPYIISTAEQLDAVRDNPSASYKLVRDIDLKDYLNQKNNPKGWEPIGRPSYAGYEGTFDGGGHKISGLWMDRTSERYTGFFGYIGTSDNSTTAIVKNLNIEIDNAKTLSGGQHTGGIAGENHGNIIGCSVSGGSVSGSFKVGKLVGNNYRTIKNCCTTGEKVYNNNKSNTACIGGFAGRSSLSNSTIEDCFSTCDVQLQTDAYSYIGGFVGVNNTESKINRCYAKGNINCKCNGIPAWVGGFSGVINLNASISDCYFIGDIMGDNYAAGGFAGAISESNLHNIYVYCEKVQSSADDFTGLFFQQVESAVRATGCYYVNDKGIKKVYNYKPNDSTVEAYGKTTEEMYKKATYEGWDFDTVWDIKEGESYPYLRSSLPMYYSFGPRSAVYTGSGQGVEITKNECGEAAGAGNAVAVMYSGATTKPVNAGNYEISVNLGAGSATNPTTGVKLLGSYTIEKATLSLDNFSYDLSATSHEEGVKRPAILSAKPGTAFTNEINDLIKNGKIWLEYKTEGENWTKDAPINAATYEVKIVVGEEATNFKSAEFTIGNYLVGEKRSIIYKNYDGTDITELDSSLPTEYIEGTEVTIPQMAPNSEMEGWDFLGYWDCALDNSQDSLVDLEGSGYENEKSLNFEKGAKIETISKDSKGDVTVFARYSSKMFDADVNGRENYIFASPGVFPNGTTASVRILEKGTDEYEKILSDVDKKDKHNVKIVEFEVFDKNGEKIQPKTFFGNTVIGFKIPDDFKVDDTSLIRITSGEDINLRSTVWSDPENPDLKYIEGTTDHFSPYAILSPWSDFFAASEDDFTETGETNWVLIAFISSAVVVLAALALLWYKKLHPKNYKHS